MLDKVAGWSFTNTCNLRCAHCYNASGKRSIDELTLEESLQIADKLKDEGVVAVNFGGGECALKPGFIDLCKHIHDLGINISYTTNGTTFNLIKDHLDLFHDIGVSIDFADRERHDRFRGVPGVYDKAIPTLEALVSKGVDTEIVTCLTRLNASHKELKALHDLAVKLKVNYWRLNRFRANGRGIENKSYLQLSQQQLRKAYEYLTEYIPTDFFVPEPIFRSAFGGKYSIVGDPSGYSAFRIQSNGEVSPSVFLSESGGNIKEKTLREIFQSKIFRAIRDRKATGKCTNCKHYYHCRGGDVGASYLAYGHFDGPDPMCWISRGCSRDVEKRAIKDWNIHEKYLCTLFVPIGDKNGQDYTKT